MKLPKRLRWAFGATFLGGIIFCQIFRLTFEHAAERPLLKTGGKGRPLPVRVTTVEKRDIRNQFVTYSNLKPAKEVVIKPPSNVTVLEVLLELGTYVKKGQPLARLNSEMQALKGNLDQIDSRLKNMDFNVTMQLAKKNFLSQNEFKQKELDHKAMQIRQRITRLESGTELLSPIAGVVAEITFKDGDYIDSTATHFIKVIDTDSHRIQLHLPQNVAAKLNVGDEAQLLRQGASRNDRVKQAIATVRAISPLVDPKTGSVFVDFDIAEIPSDWIAGMFVEVQITTDLAEDVFSIPNDSLVYENNKPFIFRVKSTETETKEKKESNIVSRFIANVSKEQTRVEKIGVELGISDTKFTEIAKGLEEFDQIVVQGQGALNDSTAVEIMQ